MDKPVSKAGYDAYLSCRDKVGRMQQLKKLRGSNTYLPLSVTEDLLQLDLGLDEKIALLETTGSKDGRALEHFLTAHIFAWPQDLAALAIRIWDFRTDHLLWFRLLAAARAAHVPQRVLYTIIECAQRAGGVHLIRVVADMSGLNELSPAFHGIALHRAVQWGISHPRFDNLAQQVMTDLVTQLHPDNKSLPSAVAYLARFNPEALSTFLSDAHVSEPWRDLLRSTIIQAEQSEAQMARIREFFSKPAKKGAAAKLSRLWLPVWARHQISTDLVAHALRHNFDAGIGNGHSHRPILPAQPKSSQGWEFFAGIPTDTFESALAQLEHDDDYSRALTLLGGLLDVPSSKTLMDQMKQRIANAKDPASFMDKIPLRLRLDLSAASQKSSQVTPAHTPAGEIAALKAEETAVLKGQETATQVVFSDYMLQTDQGRCFKSDYEEVHDLQDRKAFFNLAYLNEQASAELLPSDKQPHSFWQLLRRSWQKPDVASLGALAQAARQVDGVFRLCYLNTLARFKGFDQAALKTLDFIRSKEEDDIRAVINSLGSIGTPRAAQELVAALTRPNITPTLQLEICQILQKQDVSNLQNEIRSAIQDLTTDDKSPESAELSSWEVRDAMASLLHPLASNDAHTKSSAATTPTAMINDQQLDHLLAGKIANYKDLSSEVKRALRTSQFFHMQVTGTNAPDSIDLSPVIDMQYKALELLFREIFEEPCSRMIHRGFLQRKLDIIGYARPIPRAMDEFEQYVSLLPTIKDIPFFSKFKLRKMLRAICLFRPGKRFTLDGLKAFALFFLCFGRSQCQYGMSGLINLGFKDDQELFAFCKALHILQDFRNRAAHEGFHPDASNDIDGIWQTTAEIVQTSFKVKTFIEGNNAEDYAPRNKSNPIIERKVS